MPETAKSYLYGKAPKHIILKGDKTKQTESAEHIIEFPGGAIELARTSDNNYWAHIIVNRQFADDDFKGIHNRMGEIVDSRIDTLHGVIEIPDCKDVIQIAILIKPK